MYVTSFVSHVIRVPRNLRIDIKDRLEEYSQSIEIDIHDCTQTQKSQIFNVNITNTFRAKVIQPICMMVKLFIIFTSLLPSSGTPLLICQRQTTVKYKE